MYQQIKDPLSGKIQTVRNVETNMFIPFDPANTDYQKFKADVLAGAELQDAEGNVMTQDQANELIATLP